jgi:hypothetical protein
MPSAGVRRWPGRVLPKGLGAMPADVFNRVELVGSGLAGQQREKVPERPGGHPD